MEDLTGITNISEPLMDRCYVKGENWRPILVGALKGHCSNSVFHFHFIGVLARCKFKKNVKTVATDARHPDASQSETGGPYISHHATLVKLPLPHKPPLL